MSRRYDQPIVCTTNAAGRPVAFSFRGRRYRIVEVVDSWLEVGEWWEGEPETEWLRIVTHDRGTFEIYSPTPEPGWRLWRILD